MEIFKNASITIAITLSICFIFFLIWIIIMVFIIKDIPNPKIKYMGEFFSNLPIKRFFNLFSNSTLNKNEK